MQLAIIALIALACATAMSVLAFLIGRCGRKLPIDGMLPRVVYSARFSPGPDRPRPAPEPQDPAGPLLTKHRPSNALPCTCSAAAEQQVMRDHRRHAPRGPSQGSTEPKRLRSLSGWSRSACLGDRRGGRV